MERASQSSGPRARSSLSGQIRRSSSIRQSIELRRGSSRAEDSVPKEEDITPQRWVLTRQLDKGNPQLSDFVLEDDPVSEPADGEALCVAEWVSPDPYLRWACRGVTVGSVVPGFAVLRVKASSTPELAAESYLLAHSGWRTHVRLRPGQRQPPFPAPIALPQLGSLSPSLALGVLGMPGVTAYFAFLEQCTPQKGETVVVTGAAGAVGSIVGQLAHIRGCRAIGLTGSDDKAEWVTASLPFDVALNYKRADLLEALMEAAPDGVDIFFDGAGGRVSGTVRALLAPGSRVLEVGAMAGQVEAVPRPKSLPPARPPPKISTFGVFGYVERWPEAIEAMLQWVKEGEIICPEHITDGFDKLPEAFFGMMEGANRGKAVVRVCR